VLAATELGLGSCWIGWIRPRAVARVVGWTASVKPVVVITVGYPSDPDSGPPPASRRKPLTDLVRWV
jgi:nitroreductase